MVECGHRCCVCGENFVAGEGPHYPLVRHQGSLRSRTCWSCAACATLGLTTKTGIKRRSRNYKALALGRPHTRASRSDVRAKATRHSETGHDQGRILKATRIACWSRSLRSSMPSPKDVSRVSVKQGSILLTVATHADGAGRLLTQKKRSTELQALLETHPDLAASNSGAESLESYHDERARTDSRFNEANTVEAHLRDLLAGAASARPAQLATASPAGRQDRGPRLALRRPRRPSPPAARGAGRAPSARRPDPPEPRHRRQPLPGR